MGGIVVVGAVVGSVVVGSGDGGVETVGTVVETGTVDVVVGVVDPPAVTMSTFATDMFPPVEIRTPNPTVFRPLTSSEGSTGMLNA